MDWLRRNWPDLLIVVALIAVIGGIAMTLLTGGFSFPLFGSSPPAVVSGPTTPQSASASTPTAGTPPAAADPAPAVATDPAPTTVGTPSGETDIAILPPSGSSDPAATPATPATPAPTPAAGADPASAATPSAAPSPAPTTAVGSEAPYRVSVGAFGDPVNAQRLVASFQSVGLPVFTGLQGDLTIVLVGPYDTLGEAEQAAARVTAGDFGVSSPVIFRLDEGPVAGDGSPVSAQAPASTAAPAAPAAPAASAPAAAPAAPAPAASGTFLQIGAYGSSEAAQPQVARAQALGFSVASREEGGLVKLLIGPFQGDALGTARSTLDAAGIDHFPRAN